MATSFDPGRVRVRLRVDGDVVDAVEVASVRPSVARALRGRLADEVVALLPLLYSLCGKAQGLAARLALAAARGEGTNARGDEEAAREIAGEHLWRLLVDWPNVLSLPVDEALFVEGRRRLAQADFSSWVKERLQSPGGTFDRLLGALSAAAEPSATEHRLLPDFDAVASLTLWPRLDETFAAAPIHQGLAAETGAFARVPCAGLPLRARFRARLEELAFLAPGRVS